MNEIQRTVDWHTLAVPNPTEANQRISFGIHVEEFLEMMDCIQIPKARELFAETKRMLQLLSIGLKENKELEVIVTDRKELLDSMADQIVTGAGICVMHKLDIVAGLAEVNNSNYSKFDEEGNPIFNEHGKVKKGPAYQKPNLEGMY